MLLSCRDGRAAGRLWRRARCRGAARLSEAAPAAPPAAAGTDPATGIAVEASAPPAATASDTPVDANDLTGQMVADARKKLEEIDKLLKDTAQ